VRTFRVFLSSTFRDLEKEREAFRLRVVPELRRLCRSQGADFQAIDLRWGISSEAGLDQRTMQICLAEVRRCLALTPRPNFVILLGQRYGWRPVPAEIPSARLAQLVEAATDGAQVLRRWYVADTNAVPSIHRLRPRETGAIDWPSTEAELVAVLENAARNLALSGTERVMFGASATEQEIELGAFSTDPLSRVFAYICAPPGPDVERADRLESLGERLRIALPGQVQDYRNDPVPQRINRFCDDVRRDLETVIKRELSDPAHLDDLAREREEHEAFAQDRTRLFVGRREALDEIEAHTVSSSRAPFVVVGASGIGKSSLMAQACREARRHHPDAAIVSRFAGTTPQSSDTASLLRSLCRELARAFGADEGAIPQAPEALPAHLRVLLGPAHAGHPLILFVDAIDQLVDVDEGSTLPWIPEELPPYVRLYLSTLPILVEAVSRAVPTESLRTIRPLTPKECDDLLHELLRDAGRRLTEPQMQAVVALMRQSPFPLYLRLLAEQVRRWRSDSGVPAMGHDVPAIVADLLDDLSRPANHGPQLVSRAVGLLAAARHGLTEDELIENLSADPQVMGEFRERSLYPTDSTLLPPILWSRLRDDLEPYLTDRGADGATVLTFFHRQFLEQARDRYVAPRRSLLQRHLAAYFAAQPLYLDSDETVPNLRKLSELVYQQVGAGMSVETQELLTSFEFLEARVRATGPDAATEDLDRALNAGCCTDSEVLQELRDAIQARAHVLRGDPKQFASQLTGRLTATRQSELRALLNRPRQESQRRWLRPITQSLGTGSAAALIRVLGGHQAIVWRVSVSPSGRYAVSAGNDKVCIVWDLRTYTQLHVLPHDEPVFAAHISPDDRRVVTAAGATVSLWDLSRGVKLRTQQPEVGWIRDLHLIDGGQVIFGSDDGAVGHWSLDSDGVTIAVRASWPIMCLAYLSDGDIAITGYRRHEFTDRDGPVLEAWHLPTGSSRWQSSGREVNSIAVMNRGQTLVVGSDDGTVQLRDSATGKLQHSFRTTHWWADGVAVTPNDQYVVAGGVDGRVRVWDATAKDLVAELKGHRNVVRTTAALPDSQRLMSGSDDQEVRLWDLRRAKQSSAQPAHESAVNALCTSPDGRIVASASADGLVKLWDPATGACLGQLTGHETDVWSVAFTPDGSTLLSLANGSPVIVWDVASKRQLRALNLVPRAEAFANKVVPSLDNLHFFCGGELFEIASGKVVYQLPEYETGIRAVLPDGDRIVFHGNGTPLRVWSLTTGEVATLGPGSPAILSASKLITAGYELNVWDMTTWTQTMRIPTGHRGPVNGLAALPDLGLVITGSGDHDVVLWNIAAGQRLATFTAEASILCCAAANGAELMVVAGDQLGNIHFLSAEGPSSQLNTDLR
jgi:WD40 repeat protein